MVVYLVDHLAKTCLLYKFLSLPTSNKLVCRHLYALYRTQLIQTVLSKI
jgi:hypothetical protein